jgi:hypothetical protein
MGPVLVFLAGPLVLIGGLSLLPAGRVALVGLALAAVAVIVLVPLALPEDGTGFGRLALWLYGGAVGLAAVLQFARMLPAGGVPWGLVAGLAVAVALVAAARLLGLF